MPQLEPVIFRIGMTMHDMERSVTEFVLSHFQGNKTQTARSLGISVRGLEMKMQRYVEEGTTEAARRDIVRQQRREHDLRARGMLPPLGQTLEQILAAKAAPAVVIEEVVVVVDEVAHAPLVALPVSATESMPQRPDAPAEAPQPKLQVAKRR